MRERKAQISTSPDLICKPKGTADQKGDMTLSLYSETINLCREFLRGELRAAHIQDNEIGVLRHLCEEAFPLASDGLRLFRSRGLLLHALLWNLDRAHVRVWAQTLLILRNSLTEIFLLQLPRTDNGDLHRSSCGISSSVTSALRFVSLRS